MISNAEKKALKELCDIAARLEIPLLLVGAGARLLIFDKPQGVEGRSTTDWDWGVKIDDWSSFEELIAAMTQGIQPLFCKTSTIHRFQHIATQTIIDLVPFGPIAHPHQMLEWPSDLDRKMNVLGYEEALIMADAIAIDETLQINVVNIPAFVVLKLIAWQDRGGKKDLEDVALILQHYFDDNLYEYLDAYLSSGILELEDAGVFYLGQQIQGIFGNRVTGVIDSILNDIVNRANQIIPGLISRYAENWDEDFDFMLNQYKVLKQGLGVERPS